MTYSALRLLIIGLFLLAAQAGWSQNEHMLKDKKWLNLIDQTKQELESMKANNKGNEK